MRADLRETYRDSVVSSGTLRDVDLVPTFLAVLDDLSPAEAQALREAYRPVLDALDDGEDPDPDALQWLYEALYDGLNVAAPEGTSFGASEGDGACFGFFSHDEGRVSVETLVVSSLLLLTTLLVLAAAYVGLNGGLHAYL